MTLLTVLLTLTTGASAATQVTWASVAFVNHGEKIPYLEKGPYNLTPLGATQLQNAGSVFRDRYLSPPVNGSQLTVGTPINGLNVNDIENTQLYIASLNDEYISASATAFMQGVYPPRGESGTLTMDEESLLGNGSLAQYPLNGYQYPNIETLGSLDYNSIWLGGNQGCNNYTRNMLNEIRTPSYVYKMTQYRDFYEGLQDQVFWEFNKSILNYANAYELWEYGAYKYQHSKSIYNSLLPENLNKLRNLASEQQWLFNTNTQSIGNSDNAIAGKTLAGKMFSILAHNIGTQGSANKLSVMFGSFEPMLSFFYLSSLSSRHDDFMGLPEPGSALILELFSYSTSENAAQNLSTPFPSVDDLWVRFLFRNGTGETEPIIAYPIFGRGNSEVDMSWKEFADGMADFALTDVAEWCSSCDAVNLFCEAIEGNISSNNTASTPYVTGGGRSSGVSPTVAGVIGAAVTIAAFIIAALALIFFGFRIDRREKQNPAAKNGDLGVLKRSGSGGFKGAEKLASDTDLALKGGAGATIIRHERVGSWELNNSPTSGITHSSLDKEIESGRAVSNADYGRRSEDGIGNVNPFGDPVKPVDHI